MYDRMPMAKTTNSRRERPTACSCIAMGCAVLHHECCLWLLLLMLSFAPTKNPLQLVCINLPKCSVFLLLHMLPIYTGESVCHALIHMLVHVQLLMVISAGSCFLHVPNPNAHEKLLPLVGDIAGLQMMTTTDEVPSSQVHPSRICMHACMLVLVHSTTYMHSAQVALLSKLVALHTQRAHSRMHSACVNLGIVRCTLACIEPFRFL
jgi:hypothetical protein